MEYRTRIHTHICTHTISVLQTFESICFWNRYSAGWRQSEIKRERRGESESEGKKRKKAMGVRCSAVCATARCSEQFILAKRHTNSFWFCSVRVRVR